MNLLTHSETSDRLPSKLPELDRLRIAFARGPHPAETVEAVLGDLRALDKTLRERNSRWLALHEVSTRLARELDFNHLLETIVSSGVTLLHGQGGGMTLRDEHTGAVTIRLAFARGAFLPKLAGRYLPPNESLAHRVIATGRPLMVTDYASWEGRVPGLEHTFPGPVLVVPFFVEGAVAGTLSVTEPETSFTEDDVQTLMLLAQQAAAALERTRSRQKAAALALSEERARVARELHDGLAQDLASLLMRADMCQAALPAELMGPRKELDDICLGLQRAIREARATILALRSAHVNAPDLEHDIRARLTLFEARTGIPTQICVTGSPPAAPLPHVHPVLTSALQEALRNVEKHAAAHSVQVEVTWSRGVITLVVQDDGCGLDVAAALSERAGPLHFGLRTQCERMAAYGGDLTIESMPGCGARLTMHLPVAA